MNITPEEALHLYTIKRDRQLEIEKAIKEQEENERKHQYEMRELETKRKELERKLGMQHQEQILIDEDAAGKIFDAVCKSIEDENFSLSILNKMVEMGENALILATFDVHYININCLPEHHPGEFIAKGHEIARQINSRWTSFYYRIRYGKFEGYCITNYYHNLGLLVGGSTNFRIEKIPFYWRLLGY